MDVLSVFTRLRACILFVALALLIAVAVALNTKYSLAHGFKSKSTSSGAAVAQILVDTKFSALGSITASTTDAEINDRAPLYAEYGASAKVVRQIANVAGIREAELSVTANTNEVSNSASPSVAASYNTAPNPASAKYKVVLTASNELPIVDVDARAPTAAEAVSLADATLTGLRAAVRRLGKSQRVTPRSTLALRSLGAPEGGTIVSAPKTSKAVVDGVVIFVVLCVVLLVIDYLWRTRRRTSRLQASVDKLTPAAVRVGPGAETSEQDDPKKYDQAPESEFPAGEHDS